MFGQDLTGVIKLLTDKCNKKLEEIYPAGIPVDVTNRFNRELICAINTDSIDDLFIHYLLEDEAHKLNMPLFVRGCARNSLLAYLLGYSIINPMKSHYYCSKCGHFEYISSHYYAIDSEDKICPNCNTNMGKIGFSFDERFVFGTKDEPKEFYAEYNITDDFIPFAINRIKDGFKDINIDIGDVVRFAYNAKNMHESKNQGLQTVILLPCSINNNIYKWQNKTGKYFSQVVYEALDEFDWKKMLEDSLATIYEDEDDLSDIREKEEKILSEFNPSSYYEMAEAISASRNTWKDFDFLNYPDDITEKLFYSRDALMHLLVERGIDEENAYKIAEFVRRGWVDSRPDEWYELVNTVNMTEEICEACEEYKYIWPQSHSLDNLVSYALEQYYRGLVG